MSKEIAHTQAASSGVAGPQGAEQAGQESLLLKWGTLKGWDLRTDASRAAAQRYADFGMSMGAMQQRDTDEQKRALCDLIDAIDGEIVNDWSGETLTKEEAKRYVLGYGQDRKSTGAA
jgi:hypothetical protein